MTGHGGNIYKASAETGIPLSGILDFSASINPLGVPDSVAAVIRGSIPLLAHYPEPFAEGLASRLGEHLGVDPGTILCGNGSTELIYLAVRALAPRRMLIPAPTFAEYERAGRLLRGLSFVHYPLSRENGFAIEIEKFIAHMAGCDMAFLCNPNNPTGRLLDRDAVLAVADAAGRLGCCLVVDEAFIDFAPGQSVVHDVSKKSQLIVLRSLTKYYALPGLRVGYAVLPPVLKPLLMAHKEPWTVNSLALQAGIAALDDADYRQKTRIVMAEWKTDLEQGLDSLKIDRVPSAANFCLIRMENATEVASSLRKRGILVRECSNFPGLDGTDIRIAVRSREENEVLVKELARSCAVSS